MSDETIGKMRLWTLGDDPKQQLYSLADYSIDALARELAYRGWDVTIERPTATALRRRNAKKDSRRGR